MKPFVKVSVAVVLLLSLGIFSCQNLTNPSSDYTVTITGTVVNFRNSPLDSVIVRMNTPSKKDTTTTDGVFSFTFTSSDKNDVTATFELSHLSGNYWDTSFTATYSSSKTKLDLGEHKIRAKYSGLDSVVTGRTSAPPGVVRFMSSTYPTISIRNAGGVDVTNLTFQVLDSLGTPVDENNKATVTFKVITRPDAGVTLNHATSVTNSLGQVVVQLSSGDRAGIAQVQAYTTVKNLADTTKLDTLKSSPVSVTIAGGLPVASRFTLGSEKVNVPGLVKANLSVPIAAIVGDTFGNPVQKGTFVYFTTTGGIIKPNASTSEDGTVSVDLRTGNPLPVGGLATITATVGTPGVIPTRSVEPGEVDEAVLVKPLRGKAQKNVANSTASTRRFTKTATTFTKSINILFSGAPIVSSADSAFVVPSLGSKQIQFTVADINGNPMSQGTTVKVSGIGLDTTGAVLTGDLDKTMPDTYDRSFTQFNIAVTDKRTKNFGVNLPVSITVEVTGDNGSVKKTFTGSLASIVSGDSGTVGTISMVSNSVDSLVAAGAGSPVSTVIQARIKKVNGQPSPNVPVNFAIVKSVNGGEYLSNSIGFTDNSGIATTTLYSGIRSGLVQVQAAVTKDTVSMTSTPKSVYIKTGKIAKLVVASVSSSALSVKGGGTDNAVVVFEAKDTLGNTIDGTNQASVSVILQGDTAGASVSPKTMMTDPNTGRVTASVSSGNQSGIILVKAQSGSIISDAVQLSVSGGLPVQAQFALTLAKKNLSVLTDKTTVISVTAGDAAGNPVRAATLINFKTNGGLIDASAFTTPSGTANGTLQVVNPQPPGGIATVEARTFGANGTVIRDTQTVVFSREAVVTEIGGPFANFEIEDGLSKTFQYRVADVNGNPIAAGNTISVQALGTGSANIVLSGDINVTTGDAKVQGIGTTQFTFTARDTLKDEGKGPKPLGFKITVNGPNTVGPLTYSFDGTLKGGAGPGNEGSVASVAYMRSSKDTIFVANAGIPTADTITFRVRNLNQLPVKGAAVQFNFTQSQNASEFLSPSYAVSDDSGEVKVVVNSGIKSGVLKVEGRVTAGASSIASAPVPVYVKTGPLSSIALISVDRNQISVRGVGGEENATVVYEARDLLGNPLDYANQTKLYFNVSGVTGYDEQVKPDSALTDPFSGRVTVTVASGTRSTVLQVNARNAGNTIRSSPVPIVVHGGFAVDSNFNFKSPKRNISIFDQSPIEFKMQVGDVHGNPVKSGTAVYFETQAGIISASAFTDDFGNVGATFNSVADISRMGVKQFTASTMGQSGLIQKSINVLMSGRPIITIPSLSVDSLTLFDGTSSTLNFVIADTLGNPIASGHQYQVTLEGSIASQLLLSGDVNGFFQDTDDKVNGTRFTVNVGDLLPNGGSEGTFKLKITVTGTTGTTTKTVFGKLLAPANIVVPPSARVAASIRLESVSNNDISIAGVGGTENSTITYQVLDSVGAPVDRSNKATVTYSVNFNPNSYSSGGSSPTILPRIDSTDENGKTRVSITSGTQSGVVQIVATIHLTNPVRTISSQPVTVSINSGFADQRHFTIAPAQYNFPGLQKAFYTQDITIQVGDKYSNPVKEGTVVYFNSANGVIQTQKALTDKDGFVTMKLFSGNPYPLTPDTVPGLQQGYSRVYARTIGRDSTIIADSLDLLWTGAPVITKTDAINSYTIANGGSAGPFSFTVTDYLGHPMSAGTSITVEASGLSVSGDANILMPDTKSSGSGLTSFTFTVKDANITDTDPPQPSLITIVVTHPVYGTYKKVIASGTVD